MALVLAVVGVVLVATTRQGDLAEADAELTRRARALSVPAGRLLRRGGPEVLPDTGPEGLASQTLAGGAYVRVLRRGRVLAAYGEPPEAGDLPVPAATGLRTVAVGPQRWRSATAAVRRPPGAQVEVAVAQDSVLERSRALVRRLLVLSLGGLAAAGLLAAAAAGRALRPLARLRGAAGAVAGTRDLSTRVPVEGPEEVRALAEDLNAMLARLEAAGTQRERAFEATRRFTADAGHELRTPLATLRAGLDTLARNPGLGAGERVAVVEGLRVEQERLASLLDALQTLARGEAGGLGDEGPLDLAELADEAVAAARARHPGASFTLDTPSAASLHGSPTGLRLLLDNLLENAARHGGHRVEVAVVAAGGRLRLVVDDDGPGIPEDERAAVVERFARGRGSAPGGSGLGLALVAQQAALHGGLLHLERAPRGGLRAEVTLFSENPQSGGGP
jgi:signal transduction histidine kinase